MRLLLPYERVLDVTRLAVAYHDVFRGVTAQTAHVKAQSEKLASSSSQALTCGQARSHVCRNPKLQGAEAYTEHAQALRSHTSSVEVAAALASNSSAGPGVDDSASLGLRVPKRRSCRMPPRPEAKRDSRAVRSLISRALAAAASFGSFGSFGLRCICQPPSTLAGVILPGLQLLRVNRIAAKQFDHAEYPSARSSRSRT